MNANYMTQEQISAFADGELDGSQTEAALAALRLPEGLAAWDVYHQIGDALRSEEMAFALSPNFAPRMAARLEAEHAIVAPKPNQGQIEPQRALEGKAVAKGAMKRYALTGGAALAVAAFALLSTPQLMVASKDSTSPKGAAIMVASGARPSVPAIAPPQAPSHASSVAVASGAEYGAVILRDPRMDEYLLAHQRFSPSLYSTAQYARSATFATDSDK